jgi:hypothetical protein
MTSDDMARLMASMSLYCMTVTRLDGSWCVATRARESQGWLFHERPTLEAALSAALPEPKDPFA